ncbi:MAG TPA: potassium transporter TrkA [candidate division Zixibacteria bacterium]|nr:potassium transporter TrkA [candidate division Zixibacteria bacterium]HBY99833.1 potassium transporter TrkA [candidate division Zixibacteria bacterium]
MKHFLVIGLGNFGTGVVKTLFSEGHNLTAIDKTRSKVQAIQSFSNQALLADATDIEVLTQLDIESFDATVVSTGVDQHASILITLHLKELKCREIIVKAEDPDHGRILLAVGADRVVFPEEEMAKKLARSLSRPNLLDFIPLGEDYTVAEIAPPMHFHGKTIASLKLRQKYHVELIAIKDVLQSNFKFVPPPETVFKDTDIMVVIGKFEDIERIRE